MKIINNLEELQEEIDYITEDLNDVLQRFEDEMIKLEDIHATIQWLMDKQDD